MDQVTYEGMGPGSIAIIVEALTDNRKRTSPAVRAIFAKYGGSMGSDGAVSWMFERKGYIEVKDIDIDEIIDIAIEGGAEDVLEEEEDDEDSQATGGGSKVVKLFCQPEDLSLLNKALIEANINPSIVEFIYHPTTMQSVDETITDEKGLSVKDKFMNMLDAFDEDLDVQNVFHNCE